MNELEMTQLASRKGYRPPTLAQSAGDTPELIHARKLAREQRDAQVRGVSTIAAMREAVKAASASLPVLNQVPQIARPTPAGFREHARAGQPFLMSGIVNRWPLTSLPETILLDRFGEMHVRARVGDYINTAFAHDRAMQDMTMSQYLDLVDSGVHALPPYLGNLELPALNGLCHWPGYFEKMGPPRFWIGPAGTMTPLHCDYDDNIFAQIWGAKRIFLAPPHHDAFLYPTEANALLFGSPVDPAKPDYERYPLSRQANLVEVIVRPGDMLYVPAGWYHHVHALTFSLSSNRWARGLPFVLR
jgi:hypothetical protein